jgi:ABC-2 type transport system ATP-binding protein
MGALKTLVTNEYTEVLDISDISFHVAAGEAVGYLGPNGACEIDDDQDDGWPTRE